MREHESGTFSCASAEEPEEEERKRNLGLYHSISSFRTEMGPESVAMAGWAQGLGVPTASIADTEQTVLAKPLI